jgi:hypothetical protein
MGIEIVKRLTPEEEELAAKREELARLEAELADRELTLASLKAELAAFEGLYLRRVGFLYAELDEWSARLAELRAERASTPEAKAEASEARYIAMRTLRTPCLDPEIEDVMEVDIRQQRRCTSALRRACLRKRSHSLFQHAGVQPFLDEPHNAPVRYSTSRRLSTA